MTSSSNKSRPPSGAHTKDGDKLIRITAPNFVAGCVARDGRIEECAPILRRHLMWVTGDVFVAICKGKGWTWEVIDGRAYDPDRAAGDQAL